MSRLLNVEGFKRETIGPDECPLFYRWTLLAPRVRNRVPFKVLLHHFAPNRMDADVPHDHPRSFVTLILRGGYDDLVRCACRLSYEAQRIADEIERTGERPWCPLCAGRGLVVGDRLSAPAIRFRRATHAHMTRTDRRGAWTLVVMGPERRDWGFWRDGVWWPFRVFEERFGFTWRCDDGEAR